MSLKFNIGVCLFFFKYIFFKNLFSRFFSILIQLFNSKSHFIVLMKTPFTYPCQKTHDIKFQRHSVIQASYICNYANIIIHFQVWHLGVEFLFFKFKSFSAVKIIIYESPVL